MGLPSRWRGLGPGFLAILARVRPLYTLVNLLSSSRYVVEGDSMEPNLHSGDHLLVSRLAYRMRDPLRGEVLVLKDPVRPEMYHVKRILGLPGEEIRLQEGRVVADGRLVEEPYSIRQGAVGEQHNVGWVLVEDEYYALGDNREDSLDSRRFGPVKGQLIVGKVWLRYWPPGRWGWRP